MIITRSWALANLKPDAEFVMVDETDIDWHSKDITQPTEDEITAEVARLQAIEDYQEPRRESYLSVGEQLDMLYWDQVNGTTTWKDSITKIKTDYPKPE